ncbi:DUF2513 domain-containing protein [Sphingomonas beigongshangi]|uniref:DUF2513 domain-containing protein n=1 Tax=Sphingomonas beigongshangi TaxID=2782540 RepID=UPI001AEE2428|nr:DUF2513 domain-containing protein [Sphingomonas beigongshangi]
MTTTYKRDMNVIRDLLLEIEGGRNVFHLLDQETADALGLPLPDASLSAEDVAKLEYHLTLLAEAKFISLSRRSGGYWAIDGITWEGHDFLDSVRDPRIWKLTKAGAEQAGGFSVEMLKALAKGILKTQVEKHSGIAIEF